MGGIRRIVSGAAAAALIFTGVSASVVNAESQGQGALPVKASCTWFVFSADTGFTVIARFEINSVPAAVDFLAFTTPGGTGSGFRDGGFVVNDARGFPTFDYEAPDAYSQAVASGPAEAVVDAYKVKSGWIAQRLAGSQTVPCTRIPDQ